MAKMKIYFDPIGNTMNIWWDNPSNAHHVEEVEDPNRNDVMSIDKTGRPIGIEFIGLFPKEVNVSEIARSLSLSGAEPFLLSSIN